MRKNYTQIIKGFYNIVNILFYIVMIITAMFLIILLLNFFGVKTINPGSISFTVDTQIGETGKLSLNNNVYDVELQKASGELVIKKPSPALISLFSFYYFIGLIIFLFIIRLLKTVLWKVREGNPFEIKNGRRIGYISMLIILGVIIKALFNWSIETMLTDKTAIPGFEIFSGVNFSMMLFLVGVLLFIIAQVFEIGCRIQNRA